MTRRHQSRGESPPSTQRIQKVLATAGLGSRRACEQLVLDGRVAVNGQRVLTLPVLVDPAHDEITVDGKPVRRERAVYYLLNKPSGVFCTHDDPAGRTRAVDLLVGVRERVFPVGRLDSDSLGLLLLTNDGALAQRLTHPRFGIPKTYRVEVDGCPSPATLQRLRGGIWLSEGKTASATVSIVHRQRDRAILEIVLRERRNREIRRMLAKLGHKVRRLVRVAIGELTLHKLPVGAFRPLAPREIEYLKRFAYREKPAAPVSAPVAGSGLFTPTRRTTRPKHRAARSEGGPRDRRRGTGRARPGRRPGRRRP